MTRSVSLTITVMPSPLPLKGIRVLVPVMFIISPFIIISLLISPFSVVIFVFISLLSIVLSSLIMSTMSPIFLLIFWRSFTETIMSFLLSTFSRFLSVPVSFNFLLFQPFFFRRVYTATSTLSFFVFPFLFAFLLFLSER